MLGNNFLSFCVEEVQKNTFSRSIKSRKISDLPEADVLIKVEYSSLNYKDALSAQGHKGITRKYPHTPGIDAAGEVFDSKSDAFPIGTKVLVTGYDLGMNTSGGFQQFIRVPASWTVPIPDGLDTRKAMMFGTAGFTAALCIDEFEKHNIMPDSGKILVTGATGGVGSLAVGMLSYMGYQVVASTGKASARDYLSSLGAKEVLSRNEVIDDSGKPLLQQLWAGVVENVGGKTLSTAIKSTQRRGVIATLGNVSSVEFEATVYPFILRGIQLIGIDSAERPMETRIKLWNRIANEWQFPALNQIIKEVGLRELDDEINKILAGGQIGRVLVNLWI